MGGSFKSEIFLGCTLAHWAWFVAWYFLVVSSLTIIMGVVLTTFSFLLATNYHHIQVTQWTFCSFVLYLMDNFFERFVVILGLYFLIGVLSLVLSLYLVRGVQEQNAKKLGNWLTLHVLATFLGIFIFFCSLLFKKGQVNFGVILMGLGLWIFIHTFGFYVIHKHKRELMTHDLKLRGQKINKKVTLLNLNSSMEVGHSKNGGEYGIKIVDDDICKYITII